MFGTAIRRVSSSFDHQSLNDVLEEYETMTWTCDAGCNSFEPCSRDTALFPQIFALGISRYVSTRRSPFINETEFFDRLKLFRCNAPALPSNSTCDDASANTDWSELIGFVNDELKFIGIEFVSSLQWDTPYSTRKDVMKRGDDLRTWMRNNDDSNGASLEDTEVSGGHFWAWTVTEGELVDSLFRGFAICFPIAFFVLLFATGNFVLSIFTWKHTWISKIILGGKILLVIVVGFRITSYISDTCTMKAGRFTEDSRCSLRYG